MRVYEEYESKAEKRKAQRDSAPLKRCHPTGEARAFLLVFDEDGIECYHGSDPCYSAFGTMLFTEPGDGPHGLSGCTPSRAFLSENCRRVGFEHIPAEWQKAFAAKIESFIGEYRGKERAIYARAIRLAKKVVV